MTTTPTRIDTDVFETARVAGTAANRSAAQQLAYWVALGRSVEHATDLTPRDLDALRHGHYDDMSSLDQAAARVAFDSDIKARLASLNIADLLADRSRVSTADADGNVSVTVRTSL